MLLTIAIPTYNRAPYLEQCLRALIASIEEAREAVEVIVISNASPDHTADVVAKAAQAYPISFATNERNIGANRNIAKATRTGGGEYIWVLGDDDYPIKDCVPRLVTLLRQKPDFVILNYDTYLPNFKRYWGKKWFKLEQDKPLNGCNATMRYLGASAGFTSCVVAKRRILTSLTEAEEMEWSATGFNQLYALYRGLPSGCAGVVTDKVLLHTSHASGGGVDYVWNDYFLDGLGKIFRQLRTEGKYTAGAINAARLEVVNRFASRQLISLKIERRAWGAFARKVLAVFGPVALLSFRFWVGLAGPSWLLKARRGSAGSTARQ